MNGFAFEYPLEQSVTLSEGSLDVRVVAVAAPAGKLRSMYPLASGGVAGTVITPSVSG